MARHRIGLDIREDIYQRLVLVAEVLTDETGQRVTPTGLCTKLIEAKYNPVKKNPSVLALAMEEANKNKSISQILKLAGDKNGESRRENTELSSKTVSTK